MTFSAPHRLIIVSISIAAATCVVCYSASPWISLFALGIVLVPPLAKRKHLFAWIVAAFFLCAAVHAELRFPRPELTDISQFANAGKIRLRGVVISMSSNSGAAADAATRAIVQATEIVSPFAKQVSGRINISVNDDNFSYTDSSSSIRPHCLVEISGRISLPKPAIYPWEFDSQRMLERKRVFCQMRVSASEVKHIERKPDHGLQDVRDRTLFAIDSIRNSIVSTHRFNLGQERGNLLSSIVLGEAAVGLDDDVQKLFRETGLSHLLAASGFNLTIIVASVYFVARAITKSISLISVFSLAAVAGFVCLAGNSPSVMRAAIMCVLVIASKWAFRRLHMGSALASSLILAIIQDPICVTDIGFQLSYAATAGILLGAQPLSESFQKYIKWTPMVCMCDLVAVILVAQLTVLPLQMLYFWQVGMLFLPANIIVDPFIVPITSLGFLSSLIAPLSNYVAGCTQICWGLDQITGIMLNCIVRILKLMTSVGETQIRGAPHSVAIIFNCVFGILMLTSLASNRMVKLAFCLYALSLFCILLPHSLPNLCIAATKNQIAIIDENRNTVTFLTNDVQEDRKLARYLAYIGARRELKIDCSSTQHGQAFLTDRSGPQKDIRNRRTHGISFLDNAIQGYSFYILTRPVYEIDLVAAARFAETCKAKSTSKQCVIIFTDSHKGTAYQFTHSTFSTRVNLVADALSPRAIVLVLDSAGGKSGQPHFLQTTELKPDSTSFVSLRHHSVSLATLKQ